jgi:2-methylcitrate dehydratase
MAKTHAGSGTPGTIEKLADWALAQRSQDITDAALTQAKLLLLDSIGCGFAALNEESAHAVIKTLADIGGAARCTVIGQKSKSSSPNAVLVNGALIRILDLNDYVNNLKGEIGGHPSDNIPVALAAAESSGANGRDMLAAIVLGYEVFGRLKDLMEKGSDWDGVTVSGFVAPIMAGRLMGLDRRQLAHALALSGARSATPLAVRHGDISAAKSLANALVAQNGMQATILAQHGMTGPLDLFENPHGISAIFPRTEEFPALTAPLAVDSYIMRANIKAYPCLATGQGIVAAGIELHGRIGGDIDRLRHIRVMIADKPFLRRQKDDPGRINPTSREAADHSFNFLAAVALVDGKFGLAQFDNERWNDPKVRAVMGRLEIAVDDALNDGPPGSFPCSIVAEDVDGRAWRVDIPEPPGFSRHGLDAGAVTQKFHAITADQLSQASRERIIGAVLQLPECSSCSDFTASLAAASA